jgi:hypothetical protein
MVEMDGEALLPQWSARDVQCVVLRTREAQSAVAVVLAATTLTTMSRPRVSVTMKGLRPLIFFPASNRECRDPRCRRL